MKYFFFLILLCSPFIGNSQQTEVVNFLSLGAKLDFDVKTNTVLGETRLMYKILKATDSIFIDAKNMEVIAVYDADHEVDFNYNGKQITYKTNFKAGKTYELNIVYKAQPKKALYFINWKENKKHPEYNPQIWTQGQGKYTSNWLPSIDDMNDKLIFNLAINFKSDFKVLANGVLKDKIIKDSTTTWHYVMKKPMSSYLVALVIGNYNSLNETSKSGTPLSFYYYPKDSLKVEPTYRYSKQLFNFLEDEIGVPFPWQNYKQVPVKDFLYSGMENASCTIFSNNYVIDNVAFNDLNYVNVNAHELAHQWFGNLVTETSGTHHWLQEGFATYYALLAEKHLFGKDYYYEKLFKYSQELQEQELAGKSTALVNPKSSSVTFYKKGAWVLHILREQIGDKAFKKAVKKYLNTYRFKNARIQNFINEAEKASGTDLSQFVKLWLEDAEFYIDLVEESLLKSDFYKEYTLADCEIKTSKCQDWLKAPISDLAKSKIIKQQPKLITAETFNNTLKVRQTIAEVIQTIPINLQREFESLLQDKSYKTIEIALYKLWANFPQKRIQYLNQTKEISGYNGKNVRQLWLALALNTTGFQDDNKLKFYNELVSYTNSVYDFNTRQNAFTYIRDLKAYNDLAIKNLKQATTHHNWRFKNFAKNILKSLNQK